MAKAFIADITPLRESGQYRLFYSGEAITALARQLTLVAAPIQVYALTGSTLLVGLLGLAQFPTILVGSTLGGLASDAWDRRYVLIVAQSALVVVSVGLAANALPSNQVVWVVFVLMAFQALFFAIDAPARTSAIPRLVKTSSIPSAYALETLLSQFAKALGPIAAGIIVAMWSLTAAFSIAVGFFLVSIAIMASMRPLPASGGGRKPGLGSVIEGLQFLKSRKAIQGAFLVDISANVFGLPRALFPEMGISVFGGTAATVGLLYAAPGLGALFVAATSGWITKVKRAGFATTIAVIVWGSGIAVFGLTSVLQLALVALFIAGGADAVSTVFRAAIVQLTTPDELRGRLSGLKIAVVAGGPRLGDVEAGVVASAFGASFAAFSGGVASVVSAVAIARYFPAFYNWKTPKDGELADG